MEGIPKTADEDEHVILGDHWIVDTSRDPNADDDYTY